MRKTDTSHMLVGVQDGPFPTENGVQMSSQTTYSFTFGLIHPTFRKLLEKGHHLHEIIHCWVALLKVNHDSQHKHNYLIQVQMQKLLPK